MIATVVKRRTKQLRVPETVIGPRPFVKWAGGKSQLVGELRKRIPSSWDPERDVYVEPFLGGGALYWALRPARAHLCDACPELVGAWEVLGTSAETLIARLSEVEANYRKDSEATYYSVRSAPHWTAGDLDRVDRAVRFIFLNKAGFNGLWRVNKVGQHNVPWGRNPKATICDVDNLRACSAHLAKCQPVMSCGDFASVGPVPPGALVYLDPPYSPVSKTASFTSFTKDGFGPADQKRLVAYAARLVRQGVHVIVSQSADEEVVDLYRKKGFDCQQVPARRSINSKGYGRGAVFEYIIAGG